MTPITNVTPADAPHSAINDGVSQNSTLNTSADQPQASTACPSNLASSNTSSCPRPWIRRANRLFAHHKGATDRLVAQRNAFANGSRQDRFLVQALQESFAYHFLHNPAFQERCLNQGLRPGMMTDIDDFWALPALDLRAGQHVVSPSVPQAKILMYAPSDAPSTTSATPVPLGVPLEARSLRRLQRAVTNIGNTLKLNSRERANYLLLAPHPDVTPLPPQAWLLSLLILFTRKRAVRFADMHNCVAQLTELASEGSALRLCAFLGDLLAVASSSSAEPTWSFPSRSYAFCCGDWDERDIFLRHRSALAQWLGLPTEHLRFVCTVPQQMLPYISCSAGNLHIPLYTRVSISDPQSGALLSPNQSGLLQFLSPCLSAGYATRVQTPYRGWLEFGCSCGCRVPHIVVEAKQDILFEEPR